MAARFCKGGSTRALIALAFPLAALVPLAVPFDAAQVASVGLPGGFATLGQADAVTVKKSKKRKVVVRRPVATKKVCTISKVKGAKVKGRKVTRCKTVKVEPVLPVVTRSAVNTPPPPMAYIAPPPAPAVYYSPPPPPPSPQPAESPIAYYWIDQADSYAQAIGNSCITNASVAEHERPPIMRSPHEPCAWRPPRPI